MVGVGTSFAEILFTEVSVEETGVTVAVMAGTVLLPPPKSPLKKLSILSRKDKFCVVPASTDVVCSCCALNAVVLG